MKPLILYITFLFVIFAVVPSHVMGETNTPGSEYSYSFVHLSDIQGLHYYPSILNLTFSELESLKTQHNISAIFITGDITNGYAIDFPQYATAINFTTIPIYEISGNHDLFDTTDNYTFWDNYIPNGSSKHNYGFVFNDFIVYGFGWNDVTSLDPTAKTAMQSAISHNPAKVPLILTHAYFSWGNWVNGERDPIAYDILNSLPSNSVILAGHRHNAQQNGYIRQTVYNYTTILEDMINYQDWLTYSGGRLYTITTNGSQITRLTVSDVYLNPVFLVNNTVTYTIFPEEPRTPVSGFSADVTSGITPLTVGFTDSTTNRPTNWDWYWFDNETKSSDEQNPTTTLTTGIYNVRLYTSNSVGEDWENKTGYITVNKPLVTLVVTTSGNSDGEIYRATTGSGESLSSIRNGAGTSADPTNPYLTLGICSSNNNIANSYTILQRNMFLFNTSGLPDNAIINDVTLSVWSSTSSAENQLGSTSYGITGINPISPGIVSQNDYQNFTNTRYSDTEIPQTNIANYGYNNWAFNPDGIAAISKTGWTNVVVRTKWDIDNDTTGLTWLPYQNATQITLYAAENHVGKEPTLTILYTLPPSADFTATPQTGTGPLSVSFTDTSTNIPTSWSWAYRNSTVGWTQFASSPNPAFIFAAGTYDINLTATNDVGSDEEIKTGFITVSEEVSAPVADFTATPTNGTAPLSVAFTDQSTNTSGTGNWTFGDGDVTNATDRNPVHTYIAPGTYDVSLNVTNVYGFSNVTKSGYIFVTKYPATKIGVFRNGYWYGDWNGNSTWDVVDAAHTNGPFGQVGDIAVAGDWNGNGTTKIGVFRSGYWYIDWNNNGIWDAEDAQHIGIFGMAGDNPVIGDWTGDGISKIGVFRGGFWYVDWTGNGAWDTVDAAHTKGPFGQAGDMPFTGKW